MELSLRKSAGFTLLELIISLSVLAILTVATFPSASQMLSKWRSSAVNMELISLLNLSRSAAIRENVAVSLCPLDADDQCHDGWDRDLTLFVDSNRDGKLDSNESIIRLWQKTLHGTLDWRAFGNRNYIQFEPSGYTLKTTGSLHYCPNSYADLANFRIYISRSGRVRSESKSATCES